MYARERLTNPLRKIGGEFKEVSWDEAFGFIADKLADIKQRYGPQAVVAHLGVPFTGGSFVAFVARRFCDLYGTPNFTTGSSFCYLARSIAHNLTWGARCMPNYLDMVDTKCVLLWGSNPTESNDLSPHRLRAEVGRGAKLIVIDPKATPLAKEAYIHAQLRPGTDCALALGMLNVIIAEGLYDRDFVERWTAGFDRLTEHVKEWSPEKVEAVTWVKADTVKDMARMYATNWPSHIVQGISMDHSTNGIQASRAIAMLSALCGNLDVPGGDTYTSRLNQTNLRVEEKVAQDIPGAGADYPIFAKYVREQTVTPVIDQMITEKPYPVKALLIAGCNAALTWPNSNKVKRGFEKLDLLLVIDLFMNETAQMADVVLPGATLLERQELRDYIGRGFSLAVLANRAIEPVGNSMDDWKIWAEMAKKMGYAEYFPWKDSEELLEFLLEPSNVTLEELKRNPGGIYYAPKEFRKYLKNGFNTPSKKVELYSEIMKEHGYDPLPTFHEPAESPVSRPDLAEKYPLTFVRGQRTVAFLHSEQRHLASLRRLMPEPFLEIHPETAGSLGVGDGDTVTVESVRGSIRVKARLTEDVHPEMVAMQHGWGEANANLLTDDKARDPVSGYPGFRSVLCRVTKAR